MAMWPRSIAGLPQGSTRLTSKRHRCYCMPYPDQQSRRDKGGSETMSLIHLSVQHGHTFDEAKRRLETAVHQLQSRFGTLVRQVEWSTDRSQVRLEGIGF